ncbi:MAG TPA: hypothetical protein VNZ50_17620 [Hyphomicrobiaceae bacterium]|jgi:hypothetical protein|nr:hypothetical protein [Hyphomicrobiaceae bacterium]
MSFKSALTKTAILAALSVAVIGGSGLASSQAEAGYKHKHFGKIGVGIVLGAPIVYGGYGYGYRPCYWLYRKAMNTGSKYWWKRFHECRYGDDD